MKAQEFFLQEVSTSMQGQIRRGCSNTVARPFRNAVGAHLWPQNANYTQSRLGGFRIL